MDARPPKLGPTRHGKYNKIDSSSSTTLPSSHQRRHPHRPPSVNVGLAQTHRAAYATSDALQCSPEIDNAKWVRRKRGREKRVADKKERTISRKLIRQPRI
jgi:hypothetical protein